MKRMIAVILITVLLTPFTICTFTSATTATYYDLNFDKSIDVTGLSFAVEPTSKASAQNIAKTNKSMKITMNNSHSTGFMRLDASAANTFADVNVLWLESSFMYEDVFAAFGPEFGTGIYPFMVDADGKLRQLAYNWSGGSELAQLEKGKWYHIVASIDFTDAETSAISGAELKIWLNGELVGNGVRNSNLKTSSAWKYCRWRLDKPVSGSADFWMDNLKSYATDVVDTHAVDDFADTVITDANESDDITIVDGAISVPEGTTIAQLTSNIAANGAKTVVSDGATVTQGAVADGSILCINASNGIATKQYRVSVSSTPKTEIIAVAEFNNSFGAATVAGDSQHITLKNENGVGYANFHNESGANIKSRIDIGSSALDTTQEYIFDMKLRINSLASGTNFGMLESKVSDTVWWMGYYATPTGTFKTEDSRISGAISSYSFGEWERLSFCFNSSTGAVKIYLNGNYVMDDVVQKNSGNVIKPQLFRFFFSGSGLLDVDVDWMRIYSGTQLLGDELFLGADGITKVSDFDTTIMDPKKNLSAALNGVTVLMTSNHNLYVNGEKTEYSEQEIALEIDGEPYINEALLSRLYGSMLSYDEANNSVNGVVLTEGAVRFENKWMLPLEFVAHKIMGKILTWDDRGCAIIADKSYELQKDHYIDRFIQFHDADLIYRYMQFDNPDGKTMIDDLKANKPGNQHPRLLYTASDITYISNKIDAESVWKNAYNNLLKSADSEIVKDNSALYTAQTSNKQLAARELQDSITILARAYLLSEEAKYAEKGVEILEGLVAWTSLDHATSNLIAAHWMAAVAIGYDSFYSYMLNMEDGTTLMKKIRVMAHELAMIPIYQAYNGSNSEPSFIRIQDNFSGVCGGGLMSMLIAMADETEFPNMAAYLLENCIKTLETAACLFYPNGGYYESVGYSEYMNTNFALALVGMKNSFNNFYGLDKAKGFTELGYSLTFLQSLNTNVNYHDGSRGYVSDPLRETWGYLFEDPMQAALAKRQKDLRGENYDIEELFFYYKAVEGYEDEITAEKLRALGTDRYFYGAETGAFSSSMEVKNPTFVGYHGGLTGIPHDMLDLGMFVFEAEGVKWASDLGSDDYGLSQYFHIPNGYKYYLKRPEGENCIVLNPQNLKDDAGDTYYGQKVGARAELIENKLDLNKEFGAMAAYDLTEAYERDVISYIRGYYFGDQRRSLIIQDELVLKNADTEFYWFMHLPLGTEIAIDSSGKKATLAYGGKTLVAEMICENADMAAFISMDEKPIAFETQDGEFNIDGGAWKNQKKLAIRATGLSENVTFSVKLMPNKDSYSTYSEHKLEKIEDWRIPVDEITWSLTKTNGQKITEVGEIQTEESISIAADIGNKSESKIDGVMYFAIYDGGKLIDVKSSNCTINAEAYTEFNFPESIKIPKDVEQLKVKAFLWKKDVLQPMFENFVCE